MPPTKKNLKATKKFEKKHLGKTLDKRNQDAKVKQRHQIKAKKQSRRAKDESFYKGEQENGTAPSTSKPKKDANVGAMSVDDFFKGGFEIIDKKQPGGKAGKQLGKRKRGAAGAEQDGDEQSSDEDGGDLSDVSFEDQPVMGAGDSDDDAGSGAEEGAMSKKAMDELAQKDPEFYRYLKENDPEALDFDENADLAEVDELSGGSDASDDEEQGKKQPKKKRKTSAKADDQDDEPAVDNEVTKDMVARWKTSLTERHSLRVARQVVLAFRCAVNQTGDEEEMAQARYSVPDNQVYHDLVLASLRQIPEVIAHHLPVKESASGKTYVATDNKKFQNLTTLLKMYTTSITHLLNTLTDDATQRLAIGVLETMVPYLLSFRKLVKVLVKTIVNFWARPASSEALRITAFLVLRKLVVIGDAGIRETTLKATYQGLVQGSRVTNPHTLQGINLMKTSAAELWGIDPSVGYTTAFTFIRQLAIHLRNSIVNNKDNAHRVVCCWQYAHSLDFWSTVLAQHCNPASPSNASKSKGKKGQGGSQLDLLIYPLTQVTLGAARLVPTATFFPFRFHLVRALLRISRATRTYIPLAPLLLEVLESAELRRGNPKPASLKPLDFRSAYKAPKAYLRTRAYQDGVGEQVVELMAEFFAIWCKSVAFPEMALPVVIQVKRWLKHARKGDNAPSGTAASKKGKGKGKGRGKGKGDSRGGGGHRNSKLTGALVVLVQKLEANSRFVEGKRADVEFAPKDRAQVEAFLADLEWERTPLGAFVVSQRKMKEERLRLLDEARKDDERRRRLEKGGGEGGGVETDGEEEDDVELGDDGEDEDDEDVEGADDDEEGDDEELESIEGDVYGDEDDDE